MIKAGSYRREAAMHVLNVNLGSQRFTDFSFDRAFVVAANQNPAGGFVLAGSNSILDRLFRRQVRFVDSPDAPDEFDVLSLGRDIAFAKLVTLGGRQVFLNEKFAGNGRTCGTCHVEGNNFTIDPKFIATLPRHDPLFVAETNPALGYAFEKPELLRRFGLFIENVDGFDDLQNKFTLHSSQSVLALANSATPPSPPFQVDFTNNGRNPSPPLRLGWGNDATPDRDFAIVAIVQHYPRTLNRKAGADLGVPTDEELDAMAAYQLSLGRQEDFDLRGLRPKTDAGLRGQRENRASGVFFLEVVYTSRILATI